VGAETSTRGVPDAPLKKAGGSVGGPPPGGGLFLGRRIVPKEIRPDGSLETEKETGKWRRVGGVVPKI